LTAIETSNLLLFVGASLLLIIAPGPDIIFLVTQGVTRGPRAGFATAMGLAAGNLVHTTAAALGVSAIFRASALAFQALKIAGVAYLLYLAWKTAHEKVGDPGLAVNHRDGGGPVPHSPNLLWRGFLMNTFNPKVALFFLAFLPQFVDQDGAPVWMQMVVYGVLFTGLVVIVFGGIGVVSGMLREWIGARIARPAIGAWARWVVVAVYAGLATRLFLVSR